MGNERISQIPFLYSVDVLLIGGGLAGLPIAQMFCERGKSVLLLESGTFLGWEIGMYQRPWFTWLPQYAATAQEWFPLAAEIYSKQAGAYVALHMDKVKRKLEDRILAAGTRLIYASRPIAIRRQEAGWEVIIANKSGRQIVQAKRIVDATETGLAGRLLAGVSCRFLGGFVDPVESVRRVIEFTRVQPGWSEEQLLPEDVGAGRMVRLRQGAYDAGHVLLDISIPVEPAELDGRTSERDAEIEFIARTVSFNVAAYLVKHNPHFHKARLGWGGQHVLYGEDQNPLELLARGESIALALWKGDFAAEECLLLNPVEPVNTWKSPLALSPAAMVWRDQNDFNQLRKLPTKMMEINALPVLTETGVLVAGGGTSGAVAAYSAGHEGAQTSVLEMNGGLGGTATYGAVSYYWFGYRNAFTREIDRRVMDWNRKLGYVREDYLWGRKDNWNPEIRSYAYFDLCKEAGVKVFLDCLLVGALCEGERVCGAVVATPYGPRAALGSVCVDATGDGDLAVFAGARSVYGNQRDRMTMWASVGWFSAPGVYRGGNFATSLDCGDVLDYTRFLLVGRRRGADDLYDHAAYLAPRETRHVLGDVVLTLDDQLLQREFPDTVSLCLSNHDTKGKSAADIVYQGILPPHLEISVPYRAFLPQGLEGILVTGKALSCTHDALSALRMIDDLQQQGGAVGAAAAMAAAKGISPRNINISQLQRKMIKKGLLPRRVPGEAKIVAIEYAALVEALSGEEPLQNLDMSVHARKEAPDAVVQLFLAPSEKVLPFLRAAYPQSVGPRRLLLARILLWHGDGRGVSAVLAEIRRLLGAVPLLPERNGSTRYCQLYPDHGVMTEVTYLINALAGSSDPQGVDVLADLVGRIEKTKRNYADLRQCIWNTIEAVAYVAERQPQPGMGALLRRLLALPELQNRVMSGGLEVDLVGERLAYLVIILARALARCGEKEGLLLLAQFSVDCRITLARCAVDELAALTQFDCGNCPDAWMAALECWPESFPARPWTERIN